MKNYVDHYAKGWHEYQDDQYFQMKYWIAWTAIDKYSRNRKGYKIIELGCGLNPIWIPNGYSGNWKMSSYIGIDCNQKIICENKKKFWSIPYSDSSPHQRAEDNYVCADIRDYKPDRMFNIFAWIGADHQPDEYSEVVNHYLPFIEKDGILIFEYWKTQDHNIFNRLKGVEGITHVDGLEFIMPYVPKEKMKKWPTVNHRILEVFRKD